MPATTTRRLRLDQLLVERGLVDTRSRAQALVLAGRVRVGEGDAARHDLKSGDLVDRAAPVSVAGRRQWVSRGAHKLIAALDAFGIDPAGRVAVDVGASTGGFTDVLLQRGASRVVALDVGHGQLDWRIRTDGRVVVIEGLNARFLSMQDLPGPVDLVVIDVSFISLTQILPRVPQLLRAGADVIPLVKPQFEAGREEVGKKGIVRDPDVQARAIERVTNAAAEVGLVRIAMTPSPITGAEGNQEFLLHLRVAR